MFILSSPSGAGKTTLASHLLQVEQQLELSISATTRRQRDGEVDGRDYLFVNPDEFAAMSSRGAFLETATVFDNFYGTPRAPVEAALAAGRDVLFDIDWQGAAQLRRSAPEHAVSVFILPPSAAALRTRLAGRATDPANIIARRLSSAIHEVSHWRDYDYVIINDAIEHSLADLRAILRAERQRASRQSGIDAIVRQLQADLAV
jgi:guanylate kinase